MSEKRLRRPRDPIQLGKLIVDIATGQVRRPELRLSQKQVPPSKIAKKGGKARAVKLTAKRRREIAQQAAQTRWNQSEN